jgi:hypothetical protein
MIQRRGFLLGLLAAPAIVRASSLMPIYVPPLIFYGDAIHDDTEALQAWVSGDRRIRRTDGRPLTRHLDSESMLVNGTIRIDQKAAFIITNCHFVRAPNINEPLFFAADRPIDAGFVNISRVSLNTLQ